MSLGADILLKIRSTFESKPLEEAKKKTEELGKVTEKSGNDAASGMNVMAAATALMQGNVNGAIGAIAPLIEKLKVLKVSLLQLSLVGALLGALVTLFQSIRDRAAKAAEAVEMFRAEGFEREMKRVEDAHARWDIANNKSLEIRKLSHDFFVAEQDAYKQEALAILELSKQRELSNATSEDERRIIENKFKGRADELSGVYDTKIAEQEQKRLEQKAVDDENKIAQNEKEIARLKAMSQEQFLKAGRYTELASSWSSGLTGVSLTGGDSASDKEVKKAELARADSKKAMEEAKKREIENDALQRSAEQSRKDAKLQALRIRTQGFSREAATIATSREGSDIQSDIDKKAIEAGTRSERERIQAEIDAKEGKQQSAEERFGVQKDSLSRTANLKAREYKDSLRVVESYRKKGDSKGLMAAQEAATQADAAAEESSKALAAIGQQAVAALKRNKAEIDALKEQMKRID